MYWPVETAGELITKAMTATTATTIMSNMLQSCCFFSGTFKARSSRVLLRAFLRVGFRDARCCLRFAMQSPLNVFRKFSL